MNDLDLEAIPLSLRFPKYGRKQKGEITKAQHRIMWNYRNYEESRMPESNKSIAKYKQLLLHAIKQADEALWK